MEDIEVDNSDLIQELINGIALAGAEIAEWNRTKQSLNQQLSEFLDHDKDGSHTHHFRNYSITVTTGWNYKLNAAKYVEYAMLINPKFDPVRIVTKYELNKKRIKDCELYGSGDDLTFMSEFCVKTPKKLHVKIAVNSSNDGVEHE